MMPIQSIKQRNATSTCKQPSAHYLPSSKFYKGSPKRMQALQASRSYKSIDAKNVDQNKIISKPFDRPLYI